MSASVFDAAWSCSAWWETSAIPIGLRWLPESGERRTCRPPQASVMGPNSWAGSRMMISSPGYASLVFVISRLVWKLLPLPGLPPTNPMGLASLLRLAMTRLSEWRFWP